MTIIPSPMHKLMCDGHARCPTCCDGNITTCVHTVQRDKMNRPVVVVCLQCGATFAVRKLAAADPWKERCDGR